MSVNLRTITEKQELAMIEKENPEYKALISIYPAELSSVLINSKDKLAKICKSLSSALSYTSTNAVIMTCSNKCPYVDVCVLIKNDLTPTGYPCPIEKKVIMEMESDIVDYLEIDRNNPIEMEMLWDLIDSKILDMRASGALKSGKLTQTVEQKVGQQIVTREEIAPEIEIKMELKRIKANIMDAFVSTRRSKKKYGMNNDVSTLEQMILQAANNVSSKID